MFTIVSRRSEYDHEEGKLFLSVILYCHDYLNFLVEEALSG